MHAAEVCRELRLLNPAVEITGWGGDAMKAAGVDVKRHINSLAIMGFWEVIKKVFFVKKLFSECKELIEELKPDLILYVDYSGFNLRMAKWSFQKGYINHYFIPPKTWAWNQKRTHKLRKYFRKIYTILPFEKPFFESYGAVVEYVGNPSKESIDKLKSKELESVLEKKIIALIPGSRAGEVQKCLPIMCKLKEYYPEYAFEISGVDSIDQSLYKVAEEYKIPVYFNSFYELLNRAEIAVVTSGTATLETALMNVPQVVVFKTSWLTYQIARLFIKVKHISLVNLIANDKVVDELIQRDFNPEKLNSSVTDLKRNRANILKKYAKIHDKLGETRPATEVAKQINNQLLLLK